MFEIKVFLSKDDVLVYSVKCQNYLYFQFPSVISHEFHTLLFWNMVTREIFSTLIFGFVVLITFGNIYVTTTCVAKILT